MVALLVINTNVRVTAADNTNHWLQW